MHRIFLIRHGESQANAGLATIGPEEVALTPLGHRQAEYVARFLKDYTHLNLIVTSAYLRTKQTAGPTRVAFPSIPEEEWPVHEFTYLSSWHEENSTVEDRQPAVEAYWQIADPELVDVLKPGTPKPESFKQFITRVRDVKERLEKTELDIIAIFSHEQFITAFQLLSQHNPDELSSEHMKEFRAFLKANTVPNGAIVEAKFHKGYDEWGYKTITSHITDLQPVCAE